MEKLLIKEKLKKIGIDIKSISLGDFDQIGEFTAKKDRSPDKELYKSVGCFFRPNYERGILQHCLIEKFDLSSILEIGFGRGYSTFCMARAMCDLNIDGQITTVDPNLNEDFLKQLYSIFPKQWFAKINFIKATAESFYEENPNESYDLIYIDGDHRYEAVKIDWNYAKSHFNKFVLFDDYHASDKKQKDIECSTLINEIEGYHKELIIMDRRIFFDDRMISDEDINYGQVLLSKEA
jgi:hypothetical protein